MNISKGEILKKKVVLFIDGDDLQKEKMIAAVEKKLYGDQDVDRMIFNAGEGQTARAIEEVLSFSLFSTEKIVILKELDKLGKDEEEESGGKKNSKFDALIDFITHPRGDTPLLLFADSKKLPKRLLDALEKDAVKELKKTDVNQIREEMIRRCKEMDLSFTADAFQYFIDSVKNDVTSALMELEKLSAWSQKGEKITLEDCLRLIRSNHEEQVWGLIDEVAKQETESALKKLYQQFEQGEEPIGIISVLASSFRRMLICKSLTMEHAPKEEWSKKTGISGFVLTKTTEKSRKFSAEALQHGIRLLRCADEDSKGGKSDRFQVAERLVIDLCRVNEVDEKNDD
jgi:DNA polymerase-3 subunit delta